MNVNNEKPRFPEGIYGITDLRLSRGRSNEQVVREMIAGGIKIIQYRAKGSNISLRRMYEECLSIRVLTRNAGVLFILNDHADIACLVDADGVHVGQDDLPVAAVRELIGNHKLVGLSTHNPEQAQGAVEQGADYIGVGPVYTTHTKTDAIDPVGLEYVDYVTRHIPIPFTAIGGIKTENIQEVVAHGARTVCLVSEIVGAPNIAEKVKELNQVLGRQAHSR
jgi:thiamine-phosphate pyrophosphorylase